MPRAQSENVFQVSFKIPEEWIAKADAIAEAMSRPGIKTTRTDALRAALLRGLEDLEAEQRGEQKLARSHARATREAKKTHKKTSERNQAKPRRLSKSSPGAGG